MIRLKELNGELIFFRLAVLVAMTSFLVFLACSIYSQYEKIRSEDSYSEIMKMQTKGRTERKIACEKEPRGPFCQGPLKTAFEEGEREILESILIHTADLRRLSSYYLKLSYSMPLIALFLFYGGRWVILGKLRPLIPRQKIED